MTRITHYRGVALTTGKFVSRYTNETERARTRRGQRVLNYIGECMQQGGAVSMTTYYDGDIEYMDATLEWNTDADNERHHRGQCRANAQH